MARSSKLRFDRFGNPLPPHVYLHTDKGLIANVYGAPKGGYVGSCREGDVQAIADLGRRAAAVAARVRAQRADDAAARAQRVAAERDAAMDEALEELAAAGRQGLDFGRAILNNMLERLEKLG